MKIPMMAVLAFTQVMLVVLVSRAMIAVTGDALSAVLLVLILTITIVSWFTRGQQPRRQRSCG